jgi:hypothetical protein
MGKSVNGSLHSHGCWTNHYSTRERRRFPFSLGSFVDLCVYSGRDFQAITDVMANPPGQSETRERRYQDMLETADPAAPYELDAGKKESTIWLLGGRKFTLLRSQEVLTNKIFKHILTIGADGNIKGGRGVEDTLNEIQDKGGSAIIDHPFLLNVWSEDEIRRLYDEKKILAIEWNGGLTFPAFTAFLFPKRSPSKKSNIKAVQLSKERGIPCVANDDAHHRSDILKGAYTSYIIDNPNSSLTENLVEAIKVQSFTRVEQYSPFISPIRHFMDAKRGKKTYGET